MSEVWNHFFMASNGLSVTCNHCGKFMKRSDSSTKSMWGHLKAFHADLVGEETFRLKRTRRMRGEGGTGGNKTKMGPKAKGGERKGATTNGAKGRKKANSAGDSALNSNSSGGSTFSSASSSSGGEEELDELEEPLECSSRASNGEVGERTETDRKNGEAEEAKETEGLCRKGVATPPMANGAVEATVPPTEVQKTPTQPYVKRKRPHQKERQASEGMADESPLSIPLIAALSQQNAAVVDHQQQQLLQSGAAFVMPSSSPAGTSFGCAVPPSTTHGNAIPCPASSAFSKYSTAALLMDNVSAGGGGSVGTTSPSHAAEAPKQFSRAVGTLHLQHQQSHPLPAPRPKYGLEALSGTDTTPLTMPAGIVDPTMLANLEAAATMNRLLSEYQYQQQKNSGLSTVHPQSVQQQQLNELLALYAASALQQQKSADPQQQQQLAAQQAAAAVSWLYNWEWMAAAMAAGKQSTQQKPSEESHNLSAGGTTKQQSNMNDRKTAVASSNNSNTLNMLMTSGIPLLNALSLGGKIPGVGAKGNGMPRAAGEVTHTAKGQSNKTETNQHQQQQTVTSNRQQAKRKSPAEERDCAASLLALADTAAAEQRQREGESPPKNRKMDEQCEKQQQQQQEYRNSEGSTANGLADGASEALAESLVLYGMHRIAMELQLSYYVHGNKAGRAEFAFYCSNTENNAITQQKVTLTESADQLLLIREYANGTVVAEECWPKNAEPGTLLLSLRDKCQRRLCA